MLNVHCFYALVIVRVQIIVSKELCVLLFITMVMQDYNLSSWWLGGGARRLQGHHELQRKSCLKQTNRTKFCVYWCSSLSFFWHVQGT